MISIILNTHNRVEVTKRYLPKMLISCGYEHEVLIHDNGSTDGVDEFVRPLGKLIKSETNIGVPTGLNKLLPLCQGEYIAKIDPDFIMPEGWGHYAVNLLKHKEIGLVGFFWARSATHSDLQKGEIEKLGENIIFVPNKVFGCWVFRRGILDEVGMFYDQVIYGNWDTEFNNRLKKHGYKNVYHKFDSIHMGSDTIEEREEKDKLRLNVEIPDLYTYKLDEFRAAIQTTS